MHYGVVMFPTEYAMAPDELARALEERHQHLKGLVAQADAQAVFPQFARVRIELERAKPNETARRAGRHRRAPCGGARAVLHKASLQGGKDLRRSALFSRAYA